MGEAILMLICAIAVCVGVFVAPKMDGKTRTVGAWICVELWIATALQLIAWIYNTGHGVDVLVFVGVSAALAAFTVAVVWSIRNRQPTEDEPTPAGTFAAQTVYMRRRRL